MKALKTLWLCMLVFALPAQAVEFNRVSPEQSRVGFIATQMGEEVRGGFRDFRADLTFDPARPEAARARIEIDLASVDIGSQARNAELIGPDWLHVRAHPKASFESTAVRALGRNRFEAQGRMTIRGQTRAVKVRFTCRPLEARGLIEGGVSIKRLDYGIGQAVWGDTGIVSDVVRIQFRLLAESVPPAATGH